MEKNTTSVRKELSFYKKGNSWYAAVDGHTEAQNRMVAGADTLLECFSSGSDRVRIVLSSDVDDPGEYQFRLRRIEHDSWGATYLAKIPGNVLPRPAWLCNVTHTVFGEHPKNIYIHSVTA